MDTPMKIAKLTFIISISILLLLFPLIQIHYASNIPYYDSIDSFVNLMGKFYQGHMLYYHDFWYPHNGHRLPLQNIIFFLSYRLFDGARWPILLASYSFLTCSIAILLYQFRKDRPCLDKKFMLFAIFSVLLTFYGKYELVTNYATWAYLVELPLFLFFACVSLSYVEAKSIHSPIRFLFLILFSLLTMCSDGVGVAVWPIVLLYLFVKNESLLCKLSYALVSFLALVWFFYGNNNAGHLSFPGMIVSFEFITSFIGAFSGGNVLPMLVGIIWIFVFSMVTLRIIIYRDKLLMKERIFFWYGIIFFGLFACFMGVVGRAHFSPYNGMTGRYAIFRFMLYAPLLPLIYITKNYLPRYLKTISYALFTVVSALMVVNLFNFVNNVSNEGIKLNVGISEFRNDAMSYNDNILYLSGTATTQYLIDRLSFLENYKLSFYHGKYTHDLGRSLFSMYGSSSQLINKKGLTSINLNVSSDLKHWNYHGFVPASYFSLGFILPANFSSNPVYIVSEDGAIYGEGYLSNLTITDRIEDFVLNKKQSSRVFDGYIARVKTFENYTSKNFYLIQVIKGHSFVQVPVVIHTT